MIRIILLLVIICTSYSALAEKIERIDVQHIKGIYYVSMIFRVEATVDDVRRVLTDYERLSDLDPSILKIDILPSIEENTDRVKTLIHECLLFFCKDIVRTEDVSVDEQGNLYSQIIPEMSDLKSGKSSWKFQHLEDMVEVNFTSKIEPAFWVPPLIGTKVFKINLRKHLRQTVKNLEKLAN